MSEISPEQIANRLGDLQREYADPELVDKLYGLEIDPAASVGQKFKAWADQHYTNGSPSFDDGAVHRWKFETFLQKKGFLPVRWATAKLGMTLESFRELGDELIQRHLLDWSVDKPLIREDDVHDIRDNFESLRLTVFESHQSFCSALHDAVDEQFGLEIEPLYCATSESFGEDPLAYAHGFDSLTDEPVSLQYEHLLKTNKPMHLRPDTCSRRTLEQHRNLLEDYLFPGEEVDETGAAGSESSSRAGRR